MGASRLASEAKEAGLRMMKPGDVIYWTDDTPQGPDLARAWCKTRGLSADDVRLVKRQAPILGRKMVMVEVKRECKLRVKY